MANPLFGPEARMLLDNNETEAIKEFCESLHPATIVDILHEDFSIEDTWRFLRTTDIEHQADIFEYFPLETQVEMVEGTGRQHMADLVEEMSADDRVDLLRKLDPRVVESLLRLVDEADRRDIARLVSYPEDSVGALMTTDYAWLPSNITVGEALDRLRVQAPDTETIYYVYIVDERRRMLGIVSLRDLIMARRETPMDSVMETQVISVKVDDDREEAAQTMAHYDLLAMPVLDDDSRLVGIVTYDDVIDVVVDEATEDAHRMGAVAPMEESYLDASFTLLWRNRAFWLTCLFVAQLLTFWAMEYFEDIIATLVVLSLFVPLCISTGGNSGSQAATLITRAMALGQVGPLDWAKVLGREALMGIVLGLTLGVIGFFRATATSEDVRSSSPPRREGFEVVMPRNAELENKGDRLFEIPASAQQVISREGATLILLPEGGILGREPHPTDADKVVYKFPPKCTIPRPPIRRISLGWVIGISVAGICLWGTLVGSMLPLLFQKLGVDPGIASSPFVATSVDVTGILIYFSIARWLLGPALG